MKTMQSMELGIAGNGKIYHNLPVPQLVEKALARGEGTLTETGALNVHTGKYTGRSPKDKFIVDTPAVHDDNSILKNAIPLCVSAYQMGR